MLFKAKHVTNLKTRAEKWKTATRPIAPGTKHPMRRLLHLAGRAWFFMVKHYQGEHFAIHKTQDVPHEMRRMHDDLSRYVGEDDEIKCVVKDIKGCYPNMPKAAIQTALREITEELSVHYSGVFVPRRGHRQPCLWKVRGSKQQGRQSRKYAWMPFSDLLEIAMFSLDHAVIKKNGVLFRQISGIPMGDPLSPAMTIGTCCWMERRWMATVGTENKRYFRAKRYMDDILFMYLQSKRWDYQSLRDQFVASECYWPPLELEDGAKHTFLETRFTLDERRNDLRFELKNDNEHCMKIWRYQDFRSYGRFQQKKAVMQAALRKVFDMASDDGMLMRSAQAKLREFACVGYPAGVRRYVCVGLGHATKNETWFILSKLQR